MGELELNSGELRVLWNFANKCIEVQGLADFTRVLYSVTSWMAIAGSVVGLSDQRFIDFGIARRMVEGGGRNAVLKQFYYLVERANIGEILSEKIADHHVSVLRQKVDKALLSGPGELGTKTTWDVEGEQGITLGWGSRSGVFTLYSFLTHSMQLEERRAYLLSALVPHLHGALTRCATQHRRVLLGELTGREIEILKWILAGKTTWEMSRILDISQRTVNYHVQNAMSKLGASTRSQAVAKATQMGLLQLES